MRRLTKNALALSFIFMVLMLLVIIFDPKTTTPFSIVSWSICICAAMLAAKIIK